MSTTSPIKRNLGKRTPSSKAIWEDSPPIALRDKIWFIISLAIAGGMYVSAQQLSPHLSTRSYSLFAAVIWLSIWVLRHFKWQASLDPSDRLKAIWGIQGKRTAQLMCFLALAGSIYYAYHKANRDLPALQYEDIVALKPVGYQLYTVSGTPKVTKETHRWALYDELASAPYLTEITEYKGRLLVVSDQPLKDTLHQQAGFVNIVYELQNPHFVAYRNYMGIAQSEPLYVVDIRLVPWFDLGAWALCFLLFAFNLVIYSSAVRDENNPYRMMYIPEDLQASLEEEVVEEESTQEESAQEDEQQQAVSDPV